MSMLVYPILVFEGMLCLLEMYMCERIAMAYLLVALFALVVVMYICKTRGECFEYKYGPSRACGISSFGVSLESV